MTGRRLRSFTVIEDLTITQLVENTAGAPGLLAEHGVSFFIEADGRCLLFDTGQGCALRHNAARLGLPMDRVEAIVLSHGHYDHAGGLAEALSMTGPVDLYLHPEALAPKYNREGRSIGAPFGDGAALRAATRRVVETRAPTEIRPGIRVTGEIPRRHAIEDTGGPFFRDGLRTRPDTLPDDQALVIDTPRGVVVLLGCGHSGVVNTLEHVRDISGGRPVRALIGGMHLLRANGERLAFTAEALARFDIGSLAPNHCTGLGAVCHFRHRFPERFRESGTGARHHFTGGA